MTDRAELDLRAEIARIDRDRAETQKLGEEARKYSAETRRLYWLPWIQLAASPIIGALVGALVAHWWAHG